MDVMLHRRLRPLFAVLALVFCANGAQAQNFSCRIGTSAACLGYGDTICSSSGQCVDQNAACFDRYQCDYEGFTCKSNVTDLARTYDSLLLTHNELVEDYNRLLRDHRNLEAAARDVVSDLDNVKSCVSYATSLDEAKNCAW